MKTSTKLLLAAAFAGALIARPILAQDTPTDKGTNAPAEKASCKGKEGCKSKDGCKGKDSTEKKKE